MQILKKSIISMHDSMVTVDQNSNYTYLNALGIQRRASKKSEIAKITRSDSIG